MPNHLSLLIVFLFISSIAATEPVVTVIDNLKKAYPKDSFVVYKAANDWSTRYYGHTLLNFQLKDGQWLCVLKLSSSSGPAVLEDDIKTKAFPVVFSTKSVTNATQRCKELHDQLKAIFPQHRINVFVANSAWSGYEHNVKGSKTFANQYGSDVDIVLN